MARWRAREAIFRVPLVVVAETTRGHGPRGARVNLVLAQVAPFRPLDERTARQAGTLLAAAGGSSTVDALVAAEALACRPAMLFTADADDLRHLLAGHSGVDIVAV